MNPRSAVWEALGPHMGKQSARGTWLVRDPPWAHYWPRGPHCPPCCSIQSRHVLCVTWTPQRE